MFHGLWPLHYTLLHTHADTYYIIARPVTTRVCILTVVLRAGLLANAHVVVTERSNTITTAIKVVLTRSTQRRVWTKSPIRVLPPFKLFTPTTFYHHINIYAVYLNDITKIRDIRLPLIIVVENTTIDWLKTRSHKTEHLHLNRGHWKPIAMKWYNYQINVTRTIHYLNPVNCWDCQALKNRKNYRNR